MSNEREQKILREGIRDSFFMTYSSGSCTQSSELVTHRSSRITQSSGLVTHHFCEIVVDLLRLGHSVRFRAPGRSMHPTIREGEVITVEPVTPSGIRKGDIILYRTQKKLTAHRVIRINKNGTQSSELSSQNSSLNPHSSLFNARHSSLGTHYLFITRGDATATYDDPVHPQQVLGKVVSVERGGCTIKLDNRRAKTAYTFRFYIYCLKRWIVRRLRSIENRNAGFPG